MLVVSDKVVLTCTHIGITEECCLATLIQSPRTPSSLHFAMDAIWENRTLNIVLRRLWNNVHAIYSRRYVYARSFQEHLDILGNLDGLCYIYLLSQCFL